MEHSFFIKRNIYENVNGKREAVDQEIQEVDEEFFERLISQLPEDVYDKCVTCTFSSQNIDVVCDMDKYFRLLDILFIRDHVDPNYQSNI